MLDQPANIQPPESAYHQAVEKKSSKTINQIINSVSSVLPTAALSDDRPVSELHCKDCDVGKIHDIIDTLGKNGKAKLLFKYYRHLNKIGDDVRYVHPFKFLSIIYTDQNLKHCMREVMNDVFKRMNFVDGLKENIEKEIKHHHFFIYVNDFAKINRKRSLPFPGDDGPGRWSSISAPNPEQNPVPALLDWNTLVFS